MRFLKEEREWVNDINQSAIYISDHIQKYRGIAIEFNVDELQQAVEQAAKYDGVLNFEFIFNVLDKNGNIVYTAKSLKNARDWIDQHYVKVTRYIISVNNEGYISKSMVYRRSRYDDNDVEELRTLDKDDIVFSYSKISEIYSLTDKKDNAYVFKTENKAINWYNNYKDSALRWLTEEEKDNYKVIPISLYEVIL